jgi:hypothetical protein
MESPAPLEPTPNPPPSERFAARVAGAQNAVFGFFRPTLHCESWVPFIRAMLVLLVLTSTAVLLILLYIP